MRSRDFVLLVLAGKRAAASAARLVALCLCLTISMTVLALAVCVVSVLTTCCCRAVLTHHPRAGKLTETQVLLAHGSKLRLDRWAGSLLVLLLLPSSSCSRRKAHWQGLFGSVGIAAAGTVVTITRA